MGRNTERDALYTVGIPRDSELLQMLQDDAKDCNLSVAKLIVVRLKDWYTSTGDAAAKPAIKPTRAEQSTPEPTAEKPVTAPAITEAIVEQTHIDDNASAALDAWGF